MNQLLKNLELAMLDYTINHEAEKLTSLRDAWLELVGFSLDEDCANHDRVLAAERRLYAHGINTFVLEAH